MLNVKKLLLLVSLAVTAVLAFAGCSYFDKDYKITFMVDGAVHAVVMYDGEYLEMPDNPEKDGYEYIGWFLDDGVWEKPLLFDSIVVSTVSNELTLYARMRAIVDDETTGDTSEIYAVDSSTVIYNDILTVSDGYIAVGKDYSSHNGIIAKYNEQGNIVWQKSFGGSGDDEFQRVIEIFDGYIVHAICGSTDGNLAGLKKGTKNLNTSITIKYDKNGKLMWSKELSLIDFVPNDEGFFAVGDVWSYNASNAFVAQFSTDGKLVWSKEIGDDIKLYPEYNPGWGHSIEISKIFSGNDGYYVYGQAKYSAWFTISYGPVFMLSLDAVGNIKWQKEFAMNIIDAITMSNNGFVTAGKVSKYNNEVVIGSFPQGSVHSNCIQIYDFEMNLVFEKSLTDNYYITYTDILQIGSNTFVTGYIYGYFDKSTVYGSQGFVIGIDNSGEIFFEKNPDKGCDQIFATDQGFAVYMQNNPFVFYFGRD